MANQISILNNPYQVDWAAYVQETHCPFFFRRPINRHRILLLPPNYSFPQSQGQCLSGNLVQNAEDSTGLLPDCWIQAFPVWMLP